MEETLSKFVTALVAIFILFIFPVYIAYEKKDDISYALAVRYTQDFVDKVRSKGYITQELYSDYLKSLARTGNSYDVDLEHIYVRYDGNEPVLSDPADPDSQKMISAKRNEEIYSTEYITGVLNNGQIYPMNVNDTFNVTIKNTNVTLATVIYNIVTVNMSKSNVRIFVDYGGKILAEKWFSDNVKYIETGGINNDDIVEALPDDDIPGYNTPEDNIPEDNIPEDNIPEDNTPGYNTPEDNTPDDDIPDDDIPEDNTPTVVGAGAADANGDGEIDSKDAISIAQYLAGWNTDITIENADVNCDGKIDSKDAIAIAQYLAGWDVEIGCKDVLIEESMQYVSVKNYLAAAPSLNYKTVSSAETLYGDVLEDGKINTKDAVLLSQYIAGWDIIVNENNADVNCDGEIDTKDVVLLAQYISGWGVDIGCKDIVEKVEYTTFGDLNIEDTLITVQSYNKMVNDVKKSDEYKKYLNGNITGDTFYTYLDTMYDALNKKNTANIVNADISIINSYIDKMSNVEVLARLCSAEQGGNSSESQVLVALSVLNRAAEKARTREYSEVIKYIKEVAKSNGSSNTGTYAKSYSYSSIGSWIGSASIECTCTKNKGSAKTKQCTDNVRKLILYKPELGHFWDKPSNKSIEAAREAMEIFKNKTSYVVNDVECINVYAFKASNSKSELGATWNNWNRLFIHNNTAGKDYTAFYEK